MNLIVLFVVLLQVLTALCARCRIRERQYGLCIRQEDCNVGDESSPLTQCYNTPLHCCPADSLRIAKDLALRRAESWKTVPTTAATTVPVRVATTVPTTVATRVAMTVPAEVNELKFPTKCGNTPLYPTPQIVGGSKDQPDEYSWLAALRYGNASIFAFCGGSVINSRYVLTAAHCVTGYKVKNAGGLTGVRLGAFDSAGHICDYGTENCRHYQDFGIEKIIPHIYYNNLTFNGRYDIALIRLNRPIQFTAKMMPICLPFGGEHRDEPTTDNIMTVSGWGSTMEANETIAKRSASINRWPTDMCEKVYTHGDEKRFCAVAVGKNSCNGDSGGPLMYHFDRNRMVLEGIVSYGALDCTFTDLAGVYTRVRSYEEWLNLNMEM